MAFTDRFIKVPIGVYDVETKNLTGKEDTVDSWMKFLPFEIATYRPTYSVDDPETEYVNLVLKCGDVSVVHLTVKEFEDLINLHS